MTHQILSLKWRPRTFSEVVGQDHIMHTLINAFKSNIVAHSYMFTGPRGVGKTTTARIVAKALNCQNNPGTGCTECTNCHEISEARNLDVLEIDGASNRGIDEIRNIRELIKFPPMNSPNKVIIIDEVHMLTTPAFNALLRTLEEPPPHGKFILATTDIQKVPMTIISRCQRFDFYRLSSKIILDQMIKILQSESIQADKESLQAIAVKSTGSMRDALSTLEQVIAYSEDKISYVFEHVTVELYLYDESQPPLVIPHNASNNKTYEINNFLVGIGPSTAVGQGAKYWEDYISSFVNKKVSYTNASECLMTTKVIEQIYGF